MAEICGSRTLTVCINRPLREVYEFTAQPENLPRWAAGLATTAPKRAGDGWLIATPEGSITLRFTGPNSFGILDHYVTTAAGEETYIPMRAIAHGSNTEVLFTLFRPPDWTDERFAADAALVKRDLQALRALLEV